MANRSSDTVRLKPDTTYERVRARPFHSYVVSTSYVVSAFRLRVKLRRTAVALAEAVRRTVTSAAIVLLTIPLLAQQADRTKTEALARRATDRLQGLQREADQLALEERTLLNDLRKLEVDRQIKAEQLRSITAEADAVAGDLATTTIRLEELERQEQVERPDLEARLVDIYKRGRARYLRLLLSTSDVRQLGRATRMVAALAQLDRDRVATHQRTAKSLQSARAELEARGQRLQALRIEAQRAELAAAVAARARGDLIHDIDQRRDLNAQLAGELQSAQQKLQVTLRDLSNGVPVTEPAALPLRPFRGALEWPVAGTVRRHFGRGSGSGAVESKGIEIAAGEGTSVQAIHEGVVAFASAFAGFGNLVIVDHGAQTFSLYGDLLEIAVKRGARIERSQPVGTVGAAPAGPPGLYFELRVDGRAVDPLQWLRKK